MTTEGQGTKALGQYVTFRFKDGKERRMRFSFRSLCRLEREQDLSIRRFQELIETSANLTDLVKIIWAALIDDDYGEPGLTLDDVELLLELDRLDALAEALRQAVALSMPRSMGGVRGQRKNPPAAATK